MLPVFEVEEFWGWVVVVALNLMMFGGWALLALWLLLPDAFRAFRPLDYEPAPIVVLGEYACWSDYGEAGCISLTEAVR